MPESGTLSSVRGGLSNGHLYRDLSGRLCPTGYSRVALGYGTRIVLEHTMRPDSMLVDNLLPSLGDEVNVVVHDVLNVFLLQGPVTSPAIAAASATSPSRRVATSRNDKAATP